ncbi:MAG: response regulator, partial [bacterium]
MSGKIFIVDDEPFNLDLLEQELAEHDYVIERANDGVEALGKIDSFQPDIVLLDYMMPNMDGLEVITKLRQEERHQSLPVIFLTAKGTKEDIAKGLNAGADDYITKPFEPVELLARVRSMMRIKKMHDSLEDWNRNLESKVQEQVTHIERMGRLKRYLSPQIAETILNEEGNDLFSTHRREVTVVFIDLRGFTSFSDSAEPEEVIDFLRRYHAEMGKSIFE